MQGPNIGPLQKTKNKHAFKKCIWSMKVALLSHFGSVYMVSYFPNGDNGFAVLENSVFPSLISACREALAFSPIFHQPEHGNRSNIFDW